MSKRTLVHTNRAKLIVSLLAALSDEMLHEETEVYFLTLNTDLPTPSIHFTENVGSIEVLGPGKVVLLWTVTPHIRPFYHFSPDKRIRTHRLFGKPALGPSPPALNRTA